MEKYDFSGWATRNNLKCSDGRTIMKDAFKHCDGQVVPLVWSHQHNNPEDVLGHALLENRDEGVYAYCSFNETESGELAKVLVKHGDIRSLSIYANQLKQDTSKRVMHGVIREVSLVHAGANPGAYIENVMIHSADGEFIREVEDEFVIYPGEDIELYHADEGKEIKTEDAKMAEENKNEVKKEDANSEKTVQEVFDTFTEEQKTVVYALIGQALEDAGSDEKNNENSEGGNGTMKHNVFDQDEKMDNSVLSHAAQAEIIELAKSSAVGSLKAAMSIYADEHADVLAHGIEDIEQLFPDYKDVHPGAPELLERDQSWVGLIMKKARKSPISRIRTRQADARAAALRAKGYNNREEQKKLSGDLKLIMRTTDPQTVYRRDELHRDDIVDITDFDVVSYQKVVMKHNLEEDIALAALVGDGREDTDPDKIHENHIRSVWHDEDLYTIHYDVDVAAMESKLQGTNTSANFGEEYIFAEAVIAASLYSREKYKGKGTLDFYCTPHMLNKMLLARDLNGRRIYDSTSDLAKALNVGSIVTVEQMEGLTRVDDKGNTKKLHGIFVNFANYQFGSTKGGEITNFEDFDIDFNKYKYLMETRLSGALTEVYSAIALEEVVDDDAEA